MRFLKWLFGGLNDSNSVKSNIGRVPDDKFQNMIHDYRYDVFYRDGKIEVEHHPEREFTRRWFNDQTSKFKNYIGRSKGFGQCNRCDGTWNWKQGHTIWYKRGMGSFPFCEECYQELSPQERYNFFRKIWFQRHDSDEEVDWKRVRREVGLK